MRDGDYTCPCCRKRYRSGLWFSRHLWSGHRIEERERGEILLVQDERRRRRTLPPYRWQLVPVRLFVRRDGDEAAERAFVIDHDAGVVRVSTLLPASDLPYFIASALARLHKDGLEAEPPPASIGTAEPGRKFKHPPYRWRVVPGRLFHRPNGVAIERAAVIDHDNRLIWVAGVLTLHERGMAAALAAEDLAGRRVAPIPAAWRRAVPVLPKFVTIGYRRYEVATDPDLAGRPLATRVDHKARRVLVDGGLSPAQQFEALAHAVQTSSTAAAKATTPNRGAR
jgi:hypothetical protein